MATNSSAESLRGRDSGLRPSGGRGFGGPCSQLFGDARAAPVDVQSLERLDELISRAGHWAHGALLDADDVADERPAFRQTLKAPGQARKSNLERRKRKGTLKTTPGAAITTQNIHKTLPARSGRQCSAASRNDERTVERGVDTPWTLVHRTDISLVYVSVL